MCINDYIRKSTKMKYSLLHCIEKLKHTLVGVTETAKLHCIEKLVGVTETTLNNDVRCYSFFNSVAIIKHWNVLPIELETKISLLIQIS